MTNSLECSVCKKSLLHPPFYKKLTGGELILCGKCKREATIINTYLCKNCEEELI